MRINRYPPQEMQTDRNASKPLCSLQASPELSALPYKCCASRLNVSHDLSSMSAVFFLQSKLGMLCVPRPGPRHPQLFDFGH